MYLIPSFCPRCGQPLGEAMVDGKERHVCSACNFVYYLNPRVAAVTAVAGDSRLLLVKRGINPAKGRWSFPGGFVDLGETVEEAARREAMEETGLKVDLSGILGVYSHRETDVVVVAFAATSSGDPIPGKETMEVRWADREELPPLAFRHDPDILHLWQQWVDGRGTLFPSREGS
ncbi:MAG: NUDIX hydrolase [Firmicutes bacterium]|nr:NUDIX hydrolase [Bacillota bacterium]